jgi:sporulation and spore germination protein
VRTALIALAVALIAAGCGASEGIRDEGSQRVASPIADAGVPKRPVGIYLMRYGGLAKVTRFVSAADPKRGALEALLKGPTAKEAGERYTSAIPAGTGFSVFGPPTGSVSVDMFGGEQLDAILRTATSDDLDARQRQWLLRQIVYTMTEFSDVDNVEVTLNGASLPLSSTTPGSFLTRKIFDDDNRVVQWHDQTRCDGNHEPTGRGKALRVPTVSTDNGLVSFKGETNAKRGRIVVQLVQDQHLVRTLDRALYNQPVEGGTHPCSQFEGKLELPFGMTGHAVLRVTVRPDGGDEQPRVVENEVTIGAPVAR